jgi:hypothetical protein
MTTENNISDNQENELDLNQKNTANTPEELETNDLTLKPEPEIKVENPVNEDENLSETAILEEHEVNAKSELEKESLSINEEISQKMPSADEIEVSHGSEKPKESANEKPEIPEKKPEILGSETTPQKSEVYHETPQEQISTDEILKKLESIVNLKDSGAHYKEFNSLKEQIQNIIHKESDAAKSKHSEEDAQHYAHPATAKLNGILQIYREKQDAYHKSLELQQVENLKNRQAIIDRLKNLYTNSEAGTNLFKAIREIKEEWGNAGQVAKNEFKLLNNNYFFHLQQFYEMLDMNKEFLGQEFAHNLEKRQHIISRSKELLEETSVQKALNELQYLHKLWKEEGEPVAEEFRESTWLEFKDISNKIHDRKAELFTQIDSEQAENLTKKNEIIAKMRVISSPEKEVNHNYWQQSIKKIEDLRTEFLKLGSVPKKLSNQNWADFKEVLRVFNLKKNDFYKGLKSSQQDNLNKKLSLIQTASDNMNSDDWETIVPLFKNLQEEWKKIGHVPRSQADKIWTDFRAACNTFFNNFR